jgi:hypothetical protein
VRCKLNFYIRLQRDYEELLNISSSQMTTKNGEIKENEMAGHSLQRQIHKILKTGKGNPVTGPGGPIG